MQVKTNQTFSNLLQTAPELRHFLTKLEQLAHINSALADNLSASLAAHCKVANLRDGTLILSTSSPAWHHKLRFSSMEILSMLRKDPRWSGLKSIEVRVDYLVNVESKPSDIETPKPMSISAANRKIIQQTATYLTNQKLAEALNKLVQRHK